jgi:uncharacterized protein YeaO (DUF488 family)
MRFSASTPTGVESVTDSRVLTCGTHGLSRKMKDGGGTSWRMHLMCRSGGSTTRRKPATASGCSSTGCGRGLSKEHAHLDEWCKDVAPSTGLRQWYGHDPGRFEEFARRYRAELDEPERAAAYSQLRELAAHGPLTLLTAAKRSDISEAAVLAGPLKKNASR